MLMVESILLHLYFTGVLSRVVVARQQRNIFNIYQDYLVTKRNRFMFPNRQHQFFSVWILGSQCPQNIWDGSLLNNYSLFNAKYPPTDARLFGILRHYPYIHFTILGCLNQIRRMYLKLFSESSTLLIVRRFMALISPIPTYTSEVHNQVHFASAPHYLWHCPVPSIVGFSMSHIQRLW